jgi:hypothetical protein
MSDDPAGRRYDDREVALILKGAAEQEGRAGAREAAGGLTLPELEQVAREAGMDPALVRRSAAQLEARGGDSLGERWRGGPRELIVERVLDGELAADARGVAESLTTAVREAAGGALGSTEAVGRLFTWRGRLDGAQADVSVTPAHGRTTVRVRVALDGASQASFAKWLVAFGGAGGFLTFSLLVNAIGAFAALPVAGVVGIGYLTARRDFASAQARYAARADAVVEAVAHAVTRAVTRAATTAQPTLPPVDTPRLRG